MVRFPLMYTRVQDCAKDSSVHGNTFDGKKRVSFIVVLPLRFDESEVRTGWMNHRYFPNGEIRQAGIDAFTERDVYIFDEDDIDSAYCKALLKMKELWAQVQII